MAIFGLKKAKEVNAEKKVSAPKVAKKAAPAKTKAVTTVSTPIITPASNTSTSSSIISPRITEKSGILSQSGVYTFVVAKGANKSMIAEAVKAIYKVTPVKVAVINVAPKNVFVKGRRGVVSGFRKAIVTLKAGEKIDFV